MYKYILFISLVLQSIGCDNNRTQTKSNANSKQPSDTCHIFPYPEIPIMIVSENEKKEYMARHYWDNVDFTDSILVNSKLISQKHLIDFICLLNEISYSKENIRKGMSAFCRKVSEKKIKCNNLINNIEEYLYNGNSPLYNEYLFHIYLEEIIQLTDKNDPLLSSYKFKHELISRNNVGTKASDFRFKLPSKKTSSLYTTSIKSQYLLLIFYDPECHSCHKTMSEMLSDEILNMAIEMNKITVMAVYTNDNDKIWEENIKEFPSSWIVCNDQSYITDNALYDLKAMPTIYLLDSNKYVLLKDATYSEVKKKIEDVN